MLGRPTLTNKLVAKSMNLDERLVESVMDFCYKEWAKEFKECNHPYLYIQGLGTYGINLATVNKRIIKLLKIIRTEKKKEANGSFYRDRQQLIDGCRREIFYLFKVRRTVKKLKSNNTQLRRDGKIKINIERKLVQATKQKRKFVQDEDGQLPILPLQFSQQERPNWDSKNMGIIR